MPGSITHMLALAVQTEGLRTGYDQAQRWSWLDRARRQIIPDRETDCSALCLGLAWLAGYPVDITGTAYTGNAELLLARAGFSARDITGWTVPMIASQMRPGDMLLGPGHIVLVGADGRVLSAESDERGKAAGGQAGDQTGREVYWRTLYARPKGWTRLLRPPTDDAVPLAKPGVLVVDGDFGPATIRATQRWIGAAPDGVWGPASKRALQRKLGVTVDGVVGPVTVRALQRLVGVVADGDWGPKTTRGLQGYLNRLSEMAAL